MTAFKNIGTHDLPYTLLYILGALGNPETDTFRVEIEKARLT